MVAKLWYLKKVDIFSHLSEEEMEMLNQMTRMDELPRNQTIFFPGDRSDTIYILKRGRVRISRDTPDGRRLTLALLEPGEIFGELALAGEEQRNTMAQTVEDSFLCAASRDQFMNFLETHPDLAFEITKIIGDRRRQIEAKVEDLIYKDAPERLATILMNLFEHHRETEEGEQPVIQFSHQDLADLTGLTRPTTTNLLNKFQEDGIISLGRRKIRLIKPNRLRRSAQ